MSLLKIDIKTFGAGRFIDFVWNTERPHNQKIVHNANIGENRLHVFIFINYANLIILMDLTSPYDNDTKNIYRGPW